MIKGWLASEIRLWCVWMWAHKVIFMTKILSRLRSTGVSKLSSNFARAITQTQQSRMNLQVVWLSGGCRWSLVVFSVIYLLSLSSNTIKSSSNKPFYRDKQNNSFIPQSETQQTLKSQLARQKSIVCRMKQLSGTKIHWKKVNFT